MRVWTAAFIVLSFLLGLLVGQAIAHHKHILEAVMCGFILHNHVQRGRPRG